MFSGFYPFLIRRNFQQILFLPHIQCTMKFTYKNTETLSVTRSKQSKQLHRGKRGSRRGKIAARTRLFYAGKMGLHALGLGFIDQGTIENGNDIKIWARQPLGLWDLCISAIGSVEILGGKWKHGPNPSGPCQIQKSNV